MANNTEVIFENIEQRILKEIEDAHYAIFVSVAWFTNKKLFNALIEKAKNNCYVSIIIQLDDINSQSGIDYSQIMIGRSECFIIPQTAELLHDKFCIIDFRKVITGSYNWTYKASHNSENILILEDPTIAVQYISRFEQQKAKFDCLDTKQQERILEKSNTPISTTPKQSIVQSPPPPPPPPTTKLCPHCKKEIGYKFRYCDYCGNLQDGFDEVPVKVSCKKCKKVQDAKFIDVYNTNFCNFCGSKELAWSPIISNSVEQVDEMPF